MSARDRMIQAMIEVLRDPAPEYLGYNLCKHVAERLADWLVEQPSGWLIYQGAVRDVLDANRFGPASWEITTEEHIQDRHSWENST